MANSQFTILWVGNLADDHSQQHKVMARHLGAAGMLDALAILSKERIDVVISAHELPDGGGIDLLETVRRTNPRIARILVTEYSLAGVWRSPGLPAACAVISPVALPGVVQLARWLLARRPPVESQTHAA